MFWARFPNNGVEVRWNSESSQEAKTDDQIGAANLNRLFGPWPCLQEVAKRGVPNLTIHYMQIARLFLRVSTAEQNLAPQAGIEHRAHSWRAADRQPTLSTTARPLLSHLLTKCEASGTIKAVALITRM